MAVMVAFSWRHWSTMEEPHPQGLIARSGTEPEACSMETISPWYLSYVGGQWVFQLSSEFLKLAATFLCKMPCLLQVSGGVECPRVQKAWKGNASTLGCYRQDLYGMFSCLSRSCWPDQPHQEQPRLLLAVAPSGAPRSCPTIYEQPRGIAKQDRSSVSSYASSRSAPPTQGVDGPVPPTPAQQSLLDAWNEVLREYSADQQCTAEFVREHLRLATLDTILPGYEIQWLASQWRVSLLTDNVTALGDCFDSAVRSYLDGFTTEWLFGSTPTMHTDVTEPEEVMQRWLDDAIYPQVVPRPLAFKQVIIAHLFSGRRRPHDFQFLCRGGLYASKLLAVGPQRWHYIFSTLGELAAAWHQRFVFACNSPRGDSLHSLAGPPCETWSLCTEAGIDGWFRPSTSSIPSRASWILPLTLFGIATSVGRKRFAWC